MARFVDVAKEYAWLGTAAATLGAAIWAFITYQDTARREYLKDFNTKQVNTFFETAGTVSRLVAEPDEPKWNLQVAAFWNHHYGDLVLFEDPAIECAMTYFGLKLNTTSFVKRQQLGPYAFAVSQKLRARIEYLNSNDWKINLIPLNGTKDDLTPLLGLKNERLVVDFDKNVKDHVDEKCKKYMPPPQDIASTSQ